LSESSEAQAAAVQELSSTLASVAQKTNNNAVSAQKADTLAKTAADSGKKGILEMEEMLVSMKDITNATQKIGEIIKTIDSIASQTNMLALNAAVEAARAGEHGKGFVVVADEVRTLATQCRNAARQTAEFVTDCISKTNIGSQLATQTASAITEIVHQITDISHIINAVAKSSREQDTNIGQINESIVHISGEIQNNAHISRESLNSTQELSSEADALRQSVEDFKLRS
jgi:methyl-accepting chemotaxis protein